ncbi:hypothetical protein STAS_32972 [Striga asiatica]|uniref:Uncharacterized protein n=1 Tax=Striga asiatica TaxID=4170 RepID=A0A5A7REL4_STRAF|nr:hypothetical protein STAS_32972 [Striga asiatica]
MATNNSGFKLYSSNNSNSSSGCVGVGGAMSNSSSGSLIPAMAGNYCNDSPSNNYDGIAAGILSNSNSNPLLDSSLIPGLKHDTGLAVEWSIDEQYKLEQGLVKYANEPNIMRYIKIAASLQDKSVRDVALRCRWMNRKRRKPEDESSGKKVKDRKDKLTESTTKNTISSASSMHVPGYSLTKNHQHPSDYMLSGVLGGTTRHLLEENNRAFGQISANLSSLKPMIFGSSSSVPMKQEWGCYVNGNEGGRSWQVFV